MSVGGHYWTVRNRLAPSGNVRHLPPAREWEASVGDPSKGSVRLTGALSESGDPRSLLVVIHGLGGCYESGYAVRSAVAAERAGLSCLRLNLRGADRRGEDFYHAGLTTDLHAALASPDLVHFDSIRILGFSLGGHLALRYATETDDSRVRAVAAICSPLDLDATCRVIDGPGVGLYRWVILRALKETYRAIAARSEVPTPVERIERVRGIREWDELTVAPRFGFDSAADYYARMSVGPLLPELRVPALHVASTSDPLVPPSGMWESLAAEPPLLSSRMVDAGGHVGFPPGLDLGEAGPAGIEPQAIAWLTARG